MSNDYAIVIGQR